MAKYTIQPGFIVNGKTYPAVISELDVCNIGALVTSGRVEKAGKTSATMIVETDSSSEEE